jgi:hypothetical protein
VAWRDGPAEERQRVLVLKEHYAEPVSGRVTFHHERRCEVR